jgi:hypothetical protein
MPNPILFLDVDGVLNCHEHDPDVLCGQIHPDKVDRLNRVLRVTGAKIVLSSAWRYLIHRGEMNLQGFEWLLRSHRVLAGRLVGITAPDTMTRAMYDGDPTTWTPAPNERGPQISRWLEQNGGRTGRRYAVVDDLDLGITAEGHPFVKTVGDVGLTEADAGRLVRVLGF